MSCAGPSASRSGLRGSSSGSTGRARHTASAIRGIGGFGCGETAPLLIGSSTSAHGSSRLSTIVDDWTVFVDNDVDETLDGFYRPTSAPLLRTVNG